jgi:hypothetical protein
VAAEASEREGKVAERVAEVEVAVGESAVAAMAVAVREGSVVGARSAPRCKRRRRYWARPVGEETAEMAAVPMVDEMAGDV